MSEFPFLCWKIEYDLAIESLLEAIIRCMSESTGYCLWILFSDSDLVKTAYKPYNMRFTLLIILQ